MEPTWLRINRVDVQIERQQCLDEGKDISALAAEFDALDVDEVGPDPQLQARAVALVDKTLKLPIKADYPYQEPSRLPDIQKLRPEGPVLGTSLPPREQLLDKAYGAWMGRSAGCLLGKGVEGRRRKEIRGYLESQGRWPLTTWFSNKADEAIRKENNFPAADHPFYEENITRMVMDDDTNYTTIGLVILQQNGADFTPENVAEAWVLQIPLLNACTAERVAYRNFANLLPTPDSNGDYAGEYSTATYRNVYREWIGAQIRGDFFGYCCPGDPQRAAAFAYRDAAISHIKNGIYGEMWVAAMLAAAYVCDDMETVIRAGLAQIPAECRLQEDIEQVFGWRREGLSYEQAVEAVHNRWNEHSRHHWCHTNSNAQIVALALLWGEMDLGKTLCYSVMPAFDTDCNGATAGSVLGLMLGRKALPGEWTDPLCDTLETSVQGYNEVKLADMAAKTLEVIDAIK